jgi:hypothetical protein
MKRYGRYGLGCGSMIDIRGREQFDNWDIRLGHRHVCIICSCDLYRTVALGTCGGATQYGNCVQERLTKLTSRSSFHGMSASTDTLLPPFIACLFVGGASSSTLWPAALFLSSILMMVAGRGPTVAATTFIRNKAAQETRCAMKSL